jgi:cytochrome P450
MLDNPSELTAKPDHVPDELVFDYDYVNPRGMAELGYYAAIKTLHNGPDIIWSPRYGGHWVMTRAEDIRLAQQNYEIFSHEELFIPRTSAQLVPLTTDPPRHARYRAVLNYGFTPQKIKALRTDIRTLTVDLIEKLKSQDGCEFVSEFARIVPVIVFLNLVDLPRDRREEFIQWAIDCNAEMNLAKREQAYERVAAFLKNILDERDGPTADDLLTHISGWRHNPRCQDPGELTSMALLLFLGGLDTVAAELSLIAMHLAEHPGHRRRLREEPDIIPRATEEYLRRFALSNTGRIVTRDFTHKGVTFNKGDMVLVPVAFSGIDDRVYDNPLEVDFDRDGLVRAPASTPHFHNSFGNGPHYCLGAPLARAEIQIFLEEFPKRIPELRLDPARPPVWRAGSVEGLYHLHLLWN